MKLSHFCKKYLLTLCITGSFLTLNGQSPLEQRINMLVDAMTTQEKINQLINNSFGGTPSNPRLGIPGFFMDDGPHGLRLTTDRNGRTATAFPTGVAMTATWDEEISEKVGEAMGLEFWAFNRTQQLGPCIDLARDPRGGRSAESGGEDPYLAGHIGKAVTWGIQKHPIVATAKHFMGETKQSNRHRMDVLVTDRWMMDFAGYNFRTVLQDAGVLSIMGSYNLLNGDKGCESEYLQTTILRNRWGFPFYVVSDWDAIWDTEKALKAGVDICMGSNKYANDLPGLVTRGAVTQADLNKSVKSVLRTKILNGMLDYFPRGNTSYAKTPEINAINKLAAQKSIILLKNENKADNTPILPLPKTGIKIALIGPNATAKNLNCYGSSETFPPYAVSVREGIESKVGAANVTYSKGCDINSDSRVFFDEAKALAAAADVVIFAGGLDATQEGEGYNTGNDRKNGSINLPGQQMLLIKQLAEINPNMVVVVQSGGVCGMNYCINYIKGLVYSFYAAQEAGTAIADVLFGDYNPAGRLPMTMPKQDADLPPWHEEQFRKFTENLDGGYRWFDEHNITPEFAFGYGISYTTFTYSNLVIPATSQAGKPFYIAVDVTNTGALAGEEVVQLYMSAPSTPELWMPKKQLRGFRRIPLQPGETKTVTFRLSADDFYYWDGNQYVTQSGDFTFMVGGSSDILPLQGNIRFYDDEKKPDLRITTLYTMPRYPLKGQEVSFYALVKNEGNAVNAPETPFSIDYNINNLKVSSSLNVTTPILPGQVQLIASTGVWKGDRIEKVTLSGELSFVSENTEWDTSNNAYSRDFEIFDPALDPATSNLAFRKPATASSNYGGNHVMNMVDGDWSSRWESGRSDNEFVIVDLEALAEIEKITIHWEGAFARRYKLETSLDGHNWTIVKDITNGSGGQESHTINKVQARFLRIHCTERTTINGTKYGFSIYEFEVSGNILQRYPRVTIRETANKLLLPYAKTYLDGSQSGDVFLKEKLSFNWELLSGPSNGVVITEASSSLTKVEFNATGDYVFRLTVTNEDQFSNTKDVVVNVSNVTQSSDLALMKPATASSIETESTNALAAVDGNGSTRWSSAFANNEWWQVDLQHQVQPTSVRMVWEAAYARKFNVQISSDGVNWQLLYENNAFTGGTINIPNPESLSGRYLRVNCIERATQYGSSFYIFNVFGTYVTTTNNMPVANAGSVVESSLSEALLNGSSSYDPDGDELSFKWVQIGGPSSVSIDGANTSIAMISGLKAGNYYFMLTVDDGKALDFDIVRVSSQVNTSIKSIIGEEILVYPNPADDKLFFSFPEQVQTDSVQIVDIRGNTVISSFVHTNTVSIENIPKGIYFVRFFNKKKYITTVRFIKK